MTPTIVTYNGFTITSRLVNNIGRVAVYDPRFKRDPAIYSTSSLDLAMRFVDAYRDGVAWAMNEAFERREQDADDRDDKARANLSGGW